MTVWDELKVVLVRLREQEPGALMMYPTLELDPGMVPPVPPFGIGLAPWAAATAAELRRQFGDDVELTVGALPYPPGPEPRARPATTPPSGLLDSREITAELDGPAVVRSGHSLRHGLLVGNLSGRELQIATNGQVTAVVVDPQTCEVVGGFARLGDLAAGHLPGARGRKRADPFADRHSQLYAPVRLCGSSRGMGNPGDAHARPGPRLTPQAHTDPAARNHRLNQDHRANYASRCQLP